VRFGWNIDSIACWPRNWHRLIKCWCPTGDGRLQRRPLHRGNHIRR
jgi:hypothetical protein